jgi:23S rRNA pseudouridine1911/1915/1917 synthase
MDNPYVLEETANYAVVYKPPKMHSTDKGTGTPDFSTLLKWYAEKFPPVYDIMHRLDYETHGIVLFAKNEKSYRFFKSAQDKGEFIKEYSAICVPCVKNSPVEGFPDYSLPEAPPVVESYFRPYGPGRKLVRPMLDTKSKHKEIASDNGGFYRTEIISIDNNVFTVRLKRGFRHQIRCHLCWIGWPILNDPLYPQAVEIAPADKLALRAHALIFSDPADGKVKECRISPLYLPDYG